jgi:hypothetical protein
MARKPQRFHLAYSLARAPLAAAIFMGLVGVFSPVAATQTYEQPLPIPAGATSQVPLSQSNILTCTPPGSFHPNPTQWTVSTSEVQLGALPPSDIVPPAGHLLSVTVSSNLQPGQGFFISWSGNTECATYNGIMYFTVSAPTGPPGAPPLPPPEPLPPPGSGGDAPLPFSGEPVDGYCRVTFRKREVGLFVRRLTCDQALEILEDRSRGGDCFSVAGLKSGGPPLFICRAHGGVLISPGRGRCNPVKYEGRTYEVYRQRVLCRYARATVLRMLRNDRPYIYEFETPREGRRWRCMRRDETGAIYGACAKRVERRWISFFPRR